MTERARRTELPELLREFLSRSLPPGAPLPKTVRVLQTGEMWRKPGARAMRFTASEDFAVERVAFSWRARFPIVGPLAMAVVDELADGAGRLRVSMLGVPLQTRTGPELDVGEAMRYLAELPWAPQAIAGNRELRWRVLDERTLEAECHLRGQKATVRWEFDQEGDPVRATGVRPFPAGKAYVPTAWGGDFGEYGSFSGTRLPCFGEAWWDLPDGRFVYWRGEIIGVELLADEVDR